jgi:hypothetical protein
MRPTNRLVGATGISLSSLLSCCRKRQRADAVRRPFQSRQIKSINTAEKEPLASSKYIQILCRFRLALQRTSGPWVALPAHRLYYPVDMWPRSTCAHAATAVSAIAPVSACVCSPVLCGSSAGQSRIKNARPPSRQRANTQLHACRRRAKRPSIAAPGRQTKWGGYREGPLASDIGSFSHGRAAQTLGAQDSIA